VDFSRSIIGTAGIPSAIARTIEAHAPRILALSKAIHAHPELSFEEHFASDEVSTLLESSGFVVERGVGGLPTAFTAVAGTGDLTVGLCVEYDALPNIGQACGHNIIAGISVAAAIGLLPEVDRLGITLRVIGTPAEEHGGGKVLLLERGVFDGLTIAAMAHPFRDGTSYNPAGTSSSVVGRYRATFHGTAAHAAGAPHLGVNAADAAVITQVAIGLLRQQLPDDHRVALFVAEAGYATNIIPDKAVVEFECRAATMAEFEALRTRVRRCFEAGALATGTTLDVVATEPVYDALVQDEILCARWSEGMEFFGHDVRRPTAIAGGSTDMGNVSQVVPSIHAWVGLPGVDHSTHTHGFAEGANTPAAYDVMFESALSLAWMVCSVATDPVQRAQLVAAAAVTSRSVSGSSAAPASPAAPVSFGGAVAAPRPVQ
jgi:amidohydrolase